MGIPIIGDVIDAVKDIASEFIVDKDKRNELNFQLEALKDQADARVHDEIMAQIEVNNTEAKHGSIFVAGWRPFVGWVCGAGLAAQIIVMPLLDRIFGWDVQFDTELLILTMSGMLGMGAMRSYDRKNGTGTDDFTEVTTRTGKTPAAPVKERKKILGITLPENVPWA